MYTVYVNKDESNNFYKGMTNDLSRRMNEHRAGRTQTTRRMRNFEIVYTEEYGTFAEARTRELYLKSAAGRRFLKSKLRA